MKGKVLLSMLAVAAGILAATARDQAEPVRLIEDIIARLSQQQCYADTVRFTVSMPQLSDDVVYRVALRQGSAEGDTLLPCRYLIDWSLSGPQGESEGFSAYFAGHHYRFSGDRMQEYHLDWDSVPFMPARLAGMRSDGVQRTAQFANLLPALIADDLRRMLSDPSYSVTFNPDTLAGGNRVAAVCATMIVGGTVATESEYLFDKLSALPLRIQLENSPGTISEQSAEALYYKVSTGADACPPDNEEQLVALYADAFSRFRTSNFRIETLAGQRMPAFALPTLTGQRFTYHKGDPLPSPTVIAMLEAGGGFTEQFIADVRDALAELPFDARLILAFTDTNADHIESVAGTPAPGEEILMSGRGLARDCGAASLPSLLIVSTDGTVADAIVGFNNNLRSDVIQKMLILQQ